MSDPVDPVPRLRPDPIEQPPTVGIEVAEPVGLQPVGQNTKQQVAAWNRTDRLQHNPSGRAGLARHHRQRAHPRRNATATRRSVCAGASHLGPLNPHPYDIAHTSTSVAASQFRIALDTNQYSVPATYAHRRLMVKAYPDRVCIYFDNQLIARRPRRYGRQMRQPITTAWSSGEDEAVPAAGTSCAIWRAGPRDRDRAVARSRSQGSLSAEFDHHARQARATTSAGSAAGVDDAIDPVTVALLRRLVTRSHDRLPRRR